MNAPTRNCVLTTVAVLAAVVHAPASAQIWRCGDSYSERPCDGGREMDVQDNRSKAQQAEAAQATKRDARLADTMERERLQNEAKLDKAAESARKAQAGHKSARFDDDDPRAWDFTPKTEPVVARVPKPPKIKANPSKTSSNRATPTR